MKNLKIYLTGISTGILLGLSFPPYPFFIISFIAFIPLFFTLDQKPKRIYLLLYLTFFIYHGITNYWISSWQADSDPYLMVSGIAVWLVHPFFFMIPFAIYNFLRKRLNNELIIWSFPFIWVIFEWFHSFGEIAYPWLTIGYTQIYNVFWVQVADLGGVWLLSFIIMIVNVALYRIIKFYFLDKEETGFTKKFFKLRTELLIVTVSVIIPLIYGFIQFTHYQNTDNNKKISVGLIQPNINPWKKWEVSALAQLIEHQEIMDSLESHTKNINLYIWSETAITVLGLDFNSSHNFSYVKDELDTFNASLLSGYADIYFLKKNEERTVTSREHKLRPGTFYDSYNSAVIINPTNYSKYDTIYHKMKLTPFGERIPYVSYYKFALKWLEWGVGISNWGVGKEQFNLRVKNSSIDTKAGPIICIESIFPGFVRNFTNQGAEFLAVITNDAWYDHTIGPEQHFLISAMRAIENKRYLARCANTGVTGFINPLGQTISRAPQYKRTAIQSEISLLQDKTIYVQFGDWFPFICTFISISLIIYSLFQRKKVQVH